MVPALPWQPPGPGMRAAPSAGRCPGAWRGGVRAVSRRLPASSGLWHGGHRRTRTAEPPGAGTTTEGGHDTRRRAPPPRRPLPSPPRRRLRDGRTHLSSPGRAAGGTGAERAGLWHPRLRAVPVREERSRAGSECAERGRRTKGSGAGAAGAALEAAGRSAASPAPGGGRCSGRRQLGPPHRQSRTASARTRPTDRDTALGHGAAAGWERGGARPPTPNRRPPGTCSDSSAPFAHPQLGSNHVRAS